MKKVVKVSIGHFAFTLEEEAFRKVDSYLNDLKNHYSKNVNSAEIIDGIEERMAELILERCPEGKVVSGEVMDSVINTLGRPDDIGDESGEKDYPKNTGYGVKHLYRNPDNKVLGGICSGVAAYLNFDSTLVRLLVVLLFFISCFAFPIGCGSIIVGYIILWIVIPKAKTVEQRCEMRGDSPTISNIERNIEEAASTLGSRIEDIGRETAGFWNILGRVFSIFFGIVFTLIGIAGIITLVVLFTGVQVVSGNISEFIYMIMDMNGSTLTLFKIVLSLAVLLPFVGLLYGGIQLLFRFRSPSWRPGLIMVIVWILSLCSVATITTISTSGYWDTQSQSVTKEYVPISDTLYIKYNDLGRWQDGLSRISATPYVYELTYLENKNSDDMRIVTYPDIRLNLLDEEDAVQVRARATLFTNKMSFDQMKDAMNMSYYSISGDTLYVNPLIYDRYNEVKEVDRTLYLNVPKNITVIIEEPVHHQFTGRFNFNNIKRLYRWF